jgi:intracellular sulfur oxidation DsrE/DsrF family protein
MNRRDMIVGTGSVVGISPLVAAAPTTPGAATDGSFDLSAFEAILARPARHKQAFATPIGNGTVLHSAEASLRAYEVGFREGPGTLHVAIVLWATAVGIALDDEMWGRYPIGTYMGAAGAASPPRNPYAKRIAALIARGASFFVCDNSLGSFAYSNAKGASHDEPTQAAQNEKHAELLAHVLPDAMVVPAGTAAFNALQEAHFTAFQA